MKNLKIGKKLLVTFGTIVVLFLFTIIVAIAGMSYGGNQFKDFYEYSYPLSTKTLEIRRGLQASIKGLAISMISDDDAIVKQYLTESQNEIDEVKNNLNYLEKTYRGDTSRLSQAKDLLEEAAKSHTQIEQLAEADENAQAADLFFNHYNPLILEVQDIVIAMDENTTVLADNTYSSSRSAQNSVLILSIVISAGALIVTLLLASYLSRSIKKPIFEIEEAAKQMAQGNLETNITYESKDELGILSENMRIMASRVQYYMKEISKATALLADGDLNVAYLDPFLGDFEAVQRSVRKLVKSLDNTLTQINQSADQVASGSEQVSSGSQALSQGTTEQASSIEELAATINEISQQARNTAENAIEARQKTNSAGDEVTTCNNQMQEMIAAMEDISQKSTEIGKIIKTIEDIAFQTNILALNAAVEAARAGAAGKGFAVVADEVRNLASKSAEASKNTNALIEGAVNAVEKGTKIASETAETLLKVVDGAQSVAVIINKIADEANQQAASVDQVTLGIDQISSVIQTNSATAEESAAASEELTGQAQMLNNLVAQFKLRNNGY